MKKVIYIAKNELYSLFYSPIAWIMMILFLVLTSIDFIASLGPRMFFFEKGGIYLDMVDHLTGNITAYDGYKGYFFGVINNLYLFLPLITMGLISRETSNGTIKLLYSSPVKIREIVLGKFLAMLCFIGCLMVLLVFTVAGLAISVANPDYGQLLASMFGLFLVLATFAAIGLFVSSLTSYQIVAALITFALFYLFYTVGGLWQDIDIVRNITSYLAIGAKCGNLINGLLNLRDITYLILVTASFLLFTIIRIKSATESISRFKKALRYVAVIAVAGFVGYITNMPQVNFYLDATRDKHYTITKITQAKLAKINDGELQITAYANLLDDDGNFGRFWPGVSLNRLYVKLWEPYVRFKPDIKLNYVYYYGADTGSDFYRLYPGKTLRQIAEKEIKKDHLNFVDFLSPEQVNKFVDTKAEGFRCFWKLTYKGRSTILRIFDDQLTWPSEDEICAAINRLIATPPKILFLTGHIERAPFSLRKRDYTWVTNTLGARHSLINQGYDVDTISLDQRSVPPGIAALVLADPRTPLSPVVLQKINKYIDSGGNMLITSKPDRKSVIKPVLDKLGLSLHDGLIIQSSSQYANNCVFTYLTDTARHLSPQFTRMLDNDVIYHSDRKQRIALAGASAIDYLEKDGFHIYPLLHTDRGLSWNRLAPISNDSLQVKVNKLPSDEHGNFVTAVRMNRAINGKEQRIIMVSDADFVSELQPGGFMDPIIYNNQFGFWCFSYFSYGEFPPNTLRPKAIDVAFKVTQDSVPFFKTVYYWIIPGLIGLIGSIILIRRKRK